MLWYLLLYGFIRYFVEGIRTDPLMIPGTLIRASMVLSALMVVVSVVLLLVLGRRQQNRAMMQAILGNTEADAAADMPADALQADDTEAEFIEIDDAADPAAAEALDMPEEQAQQKPQQDAPIAEKTEEPAEEPQAQTDRKRVIPDDNGADNT